MSGGLYNQAVQSGCMTKLYDQIIPALTATLGCTFPSSVGGQLHDQSMHQPRQMSLAHHRHHTVCAAPRGRLHRPCGREREEEGGGE